MNDSFTALSYVIDRFKNYDGKPSRRSEQSVSSVREKLGNENNGLTLQFVFSILVKQGLRATLTS